MITKGELEKLVKIIRIATGKTQEQIALDAGYSKTYISEVLAPTGKITEKFVKSLKSEYADVLSGQTEIASDVSTELGDIRKELIVLKASNKILGMYLAEILAAKNKTTVTKASLELEKTINEEADRLYALLQKKLG